MAVMIRVSSAASERLSEGKPTAVQDVELQLEEAVILQNVCVINDAAVSWPVRHSANVCCEFVRVSMVAPFRFCISGLMVTLSGWLIAL